MVALGSIWGWFKVFFEVGIGYVESLSRVVYIYTHTYLILCYHIYRARNQNNVAGIKNMQVCKVGLESKSGRGLGGGRSTSPQSRMTILVFTGNAVV